MLTRPRLRSHAGCMPCKKRRKKCDEQKPTCGACQRVNRHCSWLSDKDPDSGNALVKFSDPVCEFFVRRLRREPTLSKSIDLSAFQDRICASHMLETCFKSFNSPFDPINTQRNGWSFQSTLIFAPIDGSLAWDCFLAHGLMFVGNRYKDYDLFEAGLVKYGILVRDIRAVIGNENRRCDYDTLAAISNLGILSATRTTGSWNRLRSISDSLGVGHAAGMLAILETMQPQQFQSDKALAFFENTRFTKVASAILSRRQTRLTSESWKTIPWARAKHKKDSMHKLIDLLCDIVELQSDFYILTPYDGFDLNISAGRFQEKVETLLSKLGCWRHSTNNRLKSSLEAKEKVVRLTRPVGGGSSSIQSEKAMVLCELGIFNMMLIYLCRFLDKDKSHSKVAGIPAASTIGKDSPETKLASRMLPLDLPIDAPEERAYIAAKEIVMVWEVITRNELIGIATIYLGLPMVLARAVLAREGDAAFTELDSALNGLPVFWSGTGW